MHTTLTRLREFFPFVCERPATDDDLFSFCTRRNVEVVFHAGIRRGAYVRFCGDDFIFLNSALTGFPMRYVFAHEIGHVLFHVPSRGHNGIERFDDVTRSKHHAEAEAIAAYLLLPVPELERAISDGDLKRDERLAALIATRLALLNDYGA